MKKTIISGVLYAVLGANSMTIWADDQPVTVTPAAPGGPTAMSTPSMTFPLAANPNPLSLDAGPLGKVYITGALTGLGLTQNNAGPPICNSCDKSSIVDMSNGQIFIQKTTGLVQFFLEGGGYSFPTIGQPYVRSGDATNDTFGILPVGYLKLAPGNGSFSVEVGKLPSLFGAESSFTFENTNIERGLLWNQENAVTRGLQANYTSGPLAFSLSWNDGYYTHKYNWATGSAAWTINSTNTVSFVAGGNTGTTSVKDDSSVPLAQDNGSMYNLIYTHTAGAWTIEPYLQYQNTPSNESIGIASSAHAWGGALLVNYAVNSKFSIPARLEYLDTSGSTNLLYGAGSKAWSVTVTPTYQEKIFFARLELSYIAADSSTSGFVFGETGTSTSQARAMIETGVIF
jgi:hypothetical protein